MINTVIHTQSWIAAVQYISDSGEAISSIRQMNKYNQVSTCVGKRSRASDTLWRTGRPFPLPESPFTITPPPPPLSFAAPPPLPSESDDGDSWPEASVSISLTQGGLRSTWKSAEILQLLETSKRARLMKNGSTWGFSRGNGYGLCKTVALTCFIMKFIIF